MTKLTKSKVKAAIKDSTGVIAVVARRCGVSRQSMHTFLNKPKNNDLMELLVDEQEALVDRAEARMAQLVDSGEFNAVKYVLATKGKGRGWVEKQELAVQGALQSAPTKININIPEEVMKALEGKDAS